MSPLGQGSRTAPGWRCSATDVGDDVELALRYAQVRRTFGKPIAEHQAIQFKLADMATKVEAAGC